MSKRSYGGVVCEHADGLFTCGFARPPARRATTTGAITITATVPAAVAGRAAADPPLGAHGRGIAVAGANAAVATPAAAEDSTSCLCR